LLSAILYYKLIYCCITNCRGLTIIAKQLDLSCTDQSYHAEGLVVSGLAQSIEIVASSVEGCIQRIISIVGDNGLVSGPALAERATSYWNTAPMVGLMIIRSQNTGQLSTVMKHCYKVGQTVVTH
jgi:hypothetical protein